MKTNFKILEEHNLMIHKLSGDWSMAEYKKHIKRVVSSSNWGCVTRIITDLREANLKSAIKKITFRAKVTTPKQGTMHIKVPKNKIESVKTLVRANGINTTEYQVDELRFFECWFKRHQFPTKKRKRMYYL